MIGEQRLRKYEMSMWTLQDDFINVLKPYELDPRGHIQNPIMRLNVDGTEELTFSISMYLYDGIEKKENPIWFDISNNSIVTNMYKIKVIFNKEDSEKRKIFEFLITKITERHEVEEMYCDVECEGLAFHELGKTGYKISLSSDDFYADDLKWFQSNEVSGNQPIANLKYWADKVFPPAPSGLGIDDSKVWKYEINMDWSGYNPNWNSNEVYEEPYATDWDEKGNITSDTLNEIKIKERLMDEEESNKYNLSQKIAEKFGVYCRYEYGHDDNFHINSRKVIFYNSFLVEDDFIDLTYKYNTTSISREMDGTDLVTQMYVRPVTNTATSSGWSTIMDAPPNLSKEDYLFNLDYLRAVGTIDEDQYIAIKAHETNMRSINIDLVPAENQITELERIIPELEAKLNVANNAIGLDQERITSANNLLNNLTNNTGILHITEANPKTAVLIADKREDARADSYYVKITEHGILPETVRIFRIINFGNITTTEENNTQELSTENDTQELSTGQLEDELFTGRLELDEFGELIRISNLYKGQNTSSSMVYLTYDYQPRLYYEKVKKTWERRLAKDIDDSNYYSERLSQAKTKLNTVRTFHDDLLEKKQRDILDFQMKLGPALREGYWQPDDYTDYGEKHIVTFSGFGNSDLDINKPNGTTFVKTFWDKQLFDNELDISYEFGTTQDKHYYPCIKYRSNAQTNLVYKLKELQDSNYDIDRMCLLFYDYDYSKIGDQGEQKGDQYLKAFALHSQMEFAFLLVPDINHEEEYLTPVLMLTGVKDMTETALHFMKESAFLGVLKTEMENGVLKVTADEWIKHEDLEFLNLTTSLETTTDEETEISTTVAEASIDNPGNMCYPRIEICSSMVKTTEDQLSLKYADQLLANYTDYYISTRVHSNNIYRWQLSKENPYYEDMPEDWETLIQDPAFDKTGHIVDVGDSNFYITIKPDVMMKIGSITGKTMLLFTLSNADTSIYLDAIQVLKDSAFPRVSYSIDVNSVSKDIIQDFYKYLNRIVHINDYELKFENVMGYISELTLHLDAPWEDEVEVKNYKTKFEDLFTTIVAQTEAMKKATYIDGIVSQAFSNDGTLTASTVKNSVMKVDLNYAFNNGKLTIDEKNGIWGVSDSGVVAFRGGGIFTATEKDSAGNWKWNTGIVPQGINADLISTGQLDTNLVKVYAGDQLRFQLNGDGLFAYKSFFEDFSAINEYGSDAAKIIFANAINNNNATSLDAAQYVVMNSNGLFLHIETGAFVLNENKSKYIKIGYDNIETKKTTRRFRNIYVDDFDTTNFKNGDLWYKTSTNKYYIKDTSQMSGVEEITEEEFLQLKNTPIDVETVTTTISKAHDRVEVSWDGLILRNLTGQEMLRADPDTGNLYVKGVIAADEFLVKGTKNDNVSIPLEDYLKYQIDVEMDDHVKVSETLREIFDEAGNILSQAGSTLNGINGVALENKNILQDFFNKAKNLIPTIYTDSTRPSNFKPGDIWEPESGDYFGNKYIAMSFSDKSSSTTEQPLGGWNKVIDGSIASITGAGLDINAAEGTLDLYAGSKMTLIGKSQLDLAGGDIQITGNKSINIGSKWVNIGSANGGINIISTNITDATETDNNSGKVRNAVSKVQIDRDGIIMHSNKIELMAGDTDSVAALSLNPTTGIFIGSDKTLKLSSGSIVSSANVELTPSKILFGVTNTASNTTAVEMTDEYVILAAGNMIGSLRDNTPGSNNILTGIKVTKDGIWMATGSGNGRSLVSIEPQAIQLGTATNGNNGSFIKISNKELIIGSSSDLYINTTNVGLDTTKGSQATGQDSEDIAFRLGSSESPSLYFAKGHLYVKGTVEATSFVLNEAFNNAVARTNVVQNLTQSTIAVSYYASKDSKTDAQLNELNPTSWENSASTAIGSLEKPYYLYTRSVTTYGSGQSSTSYSISYIGEDGAAGAPAVYVTNITALYYLKTNSTAISKPSNKIIDNPSSANTWTTAIPTWVNNGTYYRCEQYEWSDNQITWSNPYPDYGITAANSTATSASVTAGQARNAVQAFTTNGLTTAYLWNEKYYSVALTDASSGRDGTTADKASGMLIGSNKGITIVKTANVASDGAAMVLDSSGIALNGCSINLKAQAGDETSVISLSTDGIVIGSSKTLTVNANNFKVNPFSEASTTKPIFYTGTDDSYLKVSKRTGGSMLLSLKNIQIENESMLKNRIYYAFSVTELPDNAEVGSLGVVYNYSSGSDDDDAQAASANSRTLGFTCKNITTIPTNGTGGEPQAYYNLNSYIYGASTGTSSVGYIDGYHYVRVGNAKSTKQYAVRINVEITEIIGSGTSYSGPLQVDFFYRTLLPAANSWEVNNNKNRPRFYVLVAKSGYKNYTLFDPYDTESSPEDKMYHGTINVNATNLSIEEGNKFDIIFYPDVYSSDNLNYKDHYAYIAIESVSVKLLDIQDGNRKISLNENGLYVYNGSKWRSVNYGGQNKIRCYGTLDSDEIIGSDSINTYIKIKTNLPKDSKNIRNYYGFLTNNGVRYNLNFAAVYNSTNAFNIATRVEPVDTDDDGEEDQYVIKLFIGTSAANTFQQTGDGTLGYDITIEYE